MGQNLLTICFDEYVYYADYDYLAHSYNRSMASCFEVYMGYKEAGYDTVEEYREAMKTDQCAEGRADAYMVSFISSNLYRLSNYVAVYEEITKAE